jgi:uncharacterized protein YbjT (DUF2867 family)
MSRKALLLGGSGLIGGHLLRYLLADESYDRVIAPGRRELPVQDRKLVQYRVDLGTVLAATEDEPADLREIFAVDDIFCALGTTMKQAGSREAFEKVDYHYPLKAARLGLARGARQFLIVTALGADASSSIYYNSVKGRVEDDLQQLPFHAIHIFRPSLLTGARSQSRVGENLGKLIGQIVAPGMIGPLRKYRPIAGLTVARAMLATARKADSGIHIYESDDIQKIGG